MFSFLSFLFWIFSGSDFLHQRNFRNENRVFLTICGSIDSHFLIDVFCAKLLSLSHHVLVIVYYDPGKRSARLLVESRYMCIKCGSICIVLNFFMQNIDDVVYYWYVCDRHLTGQTRLDLVRNGTVLQLFTPCFAYQQQYPSW